MIGQTPAGGQTTKFGTIGGTYDFGPVRVYGEWKDTSIGADVVDVSFRLVLTDVTSCALATAQDLWRGIERPSKVSRDLTGRAFPQGT